MWVVLSITLTKKVTRMNCIFRIMKAPTHQDHKLKSFLMWDIGMPHLKLFSLSLRLLRNISGWCSKCSGLPKLIIIAFFIDCEIFLHFCLLSFLGNRKIEGRGWARKRVARPERFFEPKITGTGTCHSTYLNCNGELRVTQSPLRFYRCPRLHGPGIVTVYFLED